MKKTYKANKHHKELKEGTIVFLHGKAPYWVTELDSVIYYDYDPENKPEWYDEVVKEQICLECVDKKLDELLEEPTLLETEEEKILNEIAEEQYDGTLVVDPDKLATYLAKLNKRISTII